MAVGMAVIGIILIGHLRAINEPLVSGTDLDPNSTPIETADSFDRTVAGGWGISAQGGAYVVAGSPDDFAVTAGTATIRSPSKGVARAVMLKAVRAVNVDLTFRLATDKAAVGGQFVYGIVRRTGSGEEYRAKVRLTEDGAVFLQGTTVAATVEKPLGREVKVIGLKRLPGQYLRIRAQISGLNPTTLRIRAWADGTPEPLGWVVTVMDSSPDLQQAGTVGLRTYLSATASNAPVIFAVDDLVVGPLTDVAGFGQKPDQDPLLLIAGDISACSSNADEATAALLDRLPGRVIALGNLALEGGAANTLASCYGPTWGRQLARTRPVPGNQEYRTGGAKSYFDYFGASAGDPGKGYYSFEAGSWHVIVLNSNCGFVGGCGAGSQQELWLRTDLAASTASCTLVAVHDPLFSSGPLGGDPELRAFWTALYEAGADVVVSAHDVDYERFTPQDAEGRPDSAYGIRQFVVGTGGAKLGAFNLPPAATTEVRDASTAGILELKLGTANFSWIFKAAGGGTFADSGSATCHSAPTPVTEATASDSFARDVAAGWGLADSGGPWTTSSSAADFAVTSGAAKVTLATAGATRFATLRRVRSIDVDISARVSRDTTPTAGAQFVYLVGRIGSAGEYRAKLRFADDGSVRVQPTRVTNGTEAPLGAEVPVPGINAGPGTWINLRATFTGTNPTTLRIRAWSDGQPEPIGWLVTVTDGSSELQTAGAVGLRVFLSRDTNAPVIVRFDDFAAR